MSGSCHLGITVVHTCNPVGVSLASLGASVLLPVIQVPSLPDISQEYVVDEHI